MHRHEYAELIRRLADYCGDHPAPETLDPELLQLGADANEWLVDLELEA